MSDSLKQKKISTELSQLETQLSSLAEKYEVQNKRIKFLKRQNEELKAQEKESYENSEEILEQNTELKKKNRQLKNKLNEIKQILQVTRNSNATSLNSTTTIKDVVISYQTEEVQISKLELTDEDLEPLKQLPHIKSIVASENMITDVGCLFICEQLACIKNLRKLFINNNQITSVGIKSIGKLSNLRCLDLRGNELGDEGMQYISACVNLTQLSLSNNSITDEGVVMLLKHSSNSGQPSLINLRYLDITSNKISNKGGLHLCQLKELANLYLSHNSVQAAVATRLMEIPEIKVLDLRFNDIDKSEKEKIKSEAKAGLQLFL